MPLMTYEQVRPWARAIRMRTAQREMPPWYLEKNVGIQRFKDDPSLSDAEIERIARWVDGGAPQGNPQDMPPPRQFETTGGWTIGTPDLVVHLPVTTVKTLAPDFYRTIGPTPTGLTEDRYIKAIEVQEVRPQGDRFEKPAGRVDFFTLHHAVVTASQPDNLRIDPLSGDPRLAQRRSSVAGTQNVRAPQDRGESLYYVYELGQNALVFSDDSGIRLPAGSVLTSDVHLHSIGKEIQVGVDVAFKFHPVARKPKYVPQFVGIANVRDELDVPAGASDVRFDSYYVMPSPGIMTTFEPHMHASGKRMCVEAIHPDAQGRMQRRQMLNCSGYNHNWVKVYTYEDDVAPLLPAGTILHTIAWYDNSERNRRNIEPRNWKGYGSRTIDDMLIFQPRIIFLTAEQFKEEVTAREEKKRRSKTETTAQNND
jgi:hypothetical protein